MASVSIWVSIWVSTRVSIWLSLFSTSAIGVVKIGQSSCDDLELAVVAFPKCFKNELWKHDVNPSESESESVSSSDSSSNLITESDGHSIGDFGSDSVSVVASDSVNE